MHEKEFADSFQPAPTKVFGVRLETFAIGHELALIRQGNPLVTMGETSFGELDIDAKKLALGMALEICGRLGWFRKFTVCVRIHRASAEGLDAETKAFREYRANGSQDLPLQKMPRQQGVPFRYFGAPGLASLINYVEPNHKLLIETHFKGSPLNFPLGLAQIFYATHLECAGLIWVKNKQDMEREQPPKEGTPPPGQNEKVYTGDEAEKVFRAAAAEAEKGNK